MPAYIYRVSQWLEKRFNAKGGNVITDLDPSLGVEMSFPSGVEDRYLQGWNRFAVFVAVAAGGAGNFSRVRIRNPVASNVILVIEQLTVSAITTADFPFVTWGATTTDLVALATLTFTRIDPRGNPQPTAIVSSASQAAGGVAFLQRNIAANATADYINNVDQELPILPGQVIDVQAGTANQQTNVTFMWRERALELSELT